MKESGSRENEKKYIIFGYSEEELNNRAKRRFIRPGFRERGTKKDFQHHPSELALQETDDKTTKKKKNLGSHRLTELHVFRSRFR